MKTRCMKRRWLIGIPFMALLCLPLGAQDSRNGNIDGAKLRPFIRTLEGAITGAIGANFPGPFATVAPKGAYLPGYGYAFTFLINIRRGMIHSPFGAYPNESEISPKEKTQRIANLKDMLVRILLSPSNRSAKLQKEESIAIIGFFEESDPVKPEADLNTTLILSVLKGDLDELADKQDRYNELKQRVKIVEY